MKRRRSLLMISIVMTVLVLPVGLPLAQPPVQRDLGGDADFDEMTPDTPPPPGISQRVFIHLPRTGKPGHLGTCTLTTNDGVHDYGLAGWRLPDGGIIWTLNPSTVPASVGSAAAVTALSAAFATWTKADGKERFVRSEGSTAATRPRFDSVNAVLWGKISAGAIAITYVWHYTDTEVVAEVDTVFNSHYPWAVFDPRNGDECQSAPDAYDVQDIATHEFGHWVGLDDLYLSLDRDLTMYGYGAGGELKKRTLGTGDITGVRAVAP